MVQRWIRGDLGGGGSLIPISAPCAAVLCLAESTGDKRTINKNQNRNAAPSWPAHANLIISAYNHVALSWHLPGVPAYDQITYYLSAAILQPLWAEAERLIAYQQFVDEVSWSDAMHRTDTYIHSIPACSLPSALTLKGKLQEFESRSSHGPSAVRFA